MIQVGELLEAGVKTSISIDHTSAYACDYFQCMRILYSLQLHRFGQKLPLTTKRLVGSPRSTARWTSASPIAPGRSPRASART